VRFLGIGLALFGVALIAIDLMAGMPLWWTASEGRIVIGALMFFLARQDDPGAQ